MTKRRPLALGAAAAIGFGSLFFATPAAFAQEQVEQPIVDQTEEQAQAETATEATEATAEEKSDAKKPAKTEKAEPKAQAEKVDPQLAAAQKIEEEGLPLIAFGENAAGETLAYTAEELTTREQEALETFAAEAGAIEEGETVEVVAERVTEPLTPYAADEVVGGAGYLSYEGAVADWPDSACSLGFSAWTPNGDPAFLTAGHCSHENGFDEVALSIPSQQPAHLGAGAGDAQWHNNGTGKLGSFGFSQFGGPGNADAQDWTVMPGSEGSPDSAESYDLAAIDEVPTSFKPLPEVTDWSTAGSDDLAASTTEITAVGAPKVGAVSKSGRTTGKTDGAITEDDIVRGYSLLWASNEEGETRARWVKGFASTLESAGGDSGGAVYQGNTAVGVISGGAGEDERGDLTWASLLSEVPTELEGYEVALHIDAPEVVSHQNGAVLEPGETIRGTAASNATHFSYSFQPNAGSGGEVQDGKWSFEAPQEPGEYTVTIGTSNGHSRSETVTLTFTVEKPAVAAPAITSPADGSSVEAPVTKISGTGVAGATLTLSGDVEGETTVNAEGKWSIPADLQAGEYSVTAVQSVEGESSRSVTSSFTVVKKDEPPADKVEIAITSIENGASYTLANAPTSVSGTATPGATVTGSLDADNGEFKAVADAKGNWSADLGYKPALGAYTLEATASLDGETSKTVTVDFTIVESNGSGGGGDDNGKGNGGGDDDLAATGFDIVSMAPYIAGAALMALLGAAAILVAARRQKGLTDES